MIRHGILSCRRTFCIYLICTLTIIIICYQWMLSKSQPTEHYDSALYALNVLNAMESNASWILTLPSENFVSSPASHHVKTTVGFAEVDHVVHSASTVSALRIMNYTGDDLLNNNVPKWSDVTRRSAFDQPSAQSQQTVRKGVADDIFMFRADSNQEISVQQTIQDLSKESSSLGLVNVVAMSLYGSELRYTTGVIRNAYLVRQNFPGWQLWVYIESPSSSKFPPVPEDIISRLISAGAEVHYISPGDDFIPPMMWRFLIADDAAVDWFIVRDVDSRLTQRDAAAVAAWMKSGRAFHCIRDHPSHAGYAVSGGLWGGRAPRLRLIMRRSWTSMMRGVAAGYFDDMNFLNNIIWPRVVRHAYCTDSVSCERWQNAVPFPVSRRGYEHVGQVYDEHERPRVVDVQIMKHTLENRNCVPLSEMS